MYKRIKNHVKEKFPRLFKLLKFLKSLRVLGWSNPLVYNCRDYTQNDILRNILMIIVWPYCFVKYLVMSLLPKRNKGKGLAFVLIAKNEALYIKEWLDFHIKQGVSHFIIFDNESTDNFREVVEPYVQQDLVTYRLIKGKRRQCDAYNKALHDYGRKFRYMGFIDGDEFMFVRNSYDGGGGTNLYDFVDEFMTSHPKAGALGVHWLIFGSGGHITRPEGGVLRNFTKCAAPDFGNNRFVKTVIDTSKVAVFGIHEAALCYVGYYMMDETGAVISGGYPEEIHFDKIRINHYFCKSLEEYTTIKMARGDVVWGATQKKLPAFQGHDRNECTDTEILARI